MPGLEEETRSIVMILKYEDLSLPCGLDHLLCPNCSIVKEVHLSIDICDGISLDII